MNTPNGKVPIIQPLDPARLAFIKANYTQFASQVSAVMTLLKPMPLREMLEANKERRTTGMLTVPDQTYAETVAGLDQERKILEAAIHLQRVLKAER